MEYGSVYEVSHRSWKMNWERSPSMFFSFGWRFFIIDCCIQEIIQEKHGAQLFSAFIQTLEAPEPQFVTHPIQHSLLTDSFVLPFDRVYSRAAAVLINFCERVEQDTLAPYLNAIVECMLKLLNHTDCNAKQRKCNVQEQSITILVRVADMRETTFTKVDSNFIILFNWLLINILRINSTNRALCHCYERTTIQISLTTESPKWRVKAMSCV